jgi:putative restriction endonuclease
MVVDIDESIRLRAFEWLKEQESIYGDVLQRSLLQGGFEFEGERIPLIAPQGIFKPRYLDLPLSITTAPNGPYSDTFSPDGYLLYKYRGNDPSHRDNAGLRQVMTRGKPLIYFYGLAPGRYVSSWPAYIVGDDPVSLTFKVAVDEAGSVQTIPNEMIVSEGTSARRAYITAIVRQRLHQRSFREKVLYAYRKQCSLCRLRHYELLDAAHIIPDVEPEGMPSIRNGISLCKLHHAAFDGLLLGITPDYTVDISADILDESDGPMLQHGLKELHKTRIILPHDRQNWPDKEALDVRYQRFKLAS